MEILVWSACLLINLRHKTHAPAVPSTLNDLIGFDALEVGYQGAFVRYYGASGAFGDEHRRPDWRDANENLSTGSSDRRR